VTSRDQELAVLGARGVVVPTAGTWLARFRFGPVEWLRRSLTCARRQPMPLAVS